MALPNGSDVIQAAMPDHQLPDWETPNPPRRKISSRIPKSYLYSGRGGDLRTKVSRELDRILPSDRKIFGCSRRVLLAILGATFLTALAIAIGLGVGLSRRSGYVLFPLFICKCIVDVFEAVKTSLFPLIPKASRVTLHTILRLLVLVVSLLPIMITSVPWVISSSMLHLLDRIRMQIRSAVSRSGRRVLTSKWTHKGA